MINLWNSRGRLLASYRKEGQLVIKDIGEAEYVAFSKDPDFEAFGIVDTLPDFPGWFRHTFIDWDSRVDALRANLGVLFEADVSPVRRFITDHNCKIDPPRRAYIDIETDSRVSFAEAINGHTRLLSFALADEEGNKHSAVLQDDHDQAEAELWSEMWRLMGRYDQIAAWNGDRFDFAVIQKRAEFLQRRFKKQFEPYWEHNRRLLFVDQMLCFKRHHMAAESGDEKTSNKLGDVCQSLIGEGKEVIEIDDEDLIDLVGRKGLGGSTWALWEAGGRFRQKLEDYNMQDTALLPKLEAETGYLALQQTIAEVTHTFVNTYTLSPMPWIDAYLLKMAFKRQTHLPSRKPDRGGGTATSSVEGAIVMAPTKLGLHRGVHVCDFKSLYPTVIRTWNIGSETKLTEEEPGACKSALEGIYFKTDAPSMLSEFCSDMMNMRDFYKKEMKKYPPGTPEWKDVERKSKAYKIANNSGFGVTGNEYFRLFDPDITGAIIQGARVSLMCAREAALAEEKDPVYGDTDSLFVIGGSVDNFSAFVKRCNEEEFPKLLDRYNCRKDFRVIELAYEKQFDKLVFPLSKEGKPAAKRYAGLYSHYGGTVATADSKPEIRGLEFMRTDGTRLQRRMQREAIEMLLKDPNVSAGKMHEWIKRQREIFINENVPIEDIVLSKGISRDLDKYQTSGPHVRVARILEARGEDIGEGTRISYIVTNGRVSPTEVIPASDYANRFDRRHYWNKAIYPATQRVLEGAFPNRGWKRWILQANVPLTQSSFAFI